MSMSVITLTTVCVLMCPHSDDRGKLTPPLHHAPYPSPMSLPMSMSGLHRGLSRGDMGQSHALNEVTWCIVMRYVFSMP